MRFYPEQDLGVVVMGSVNGYRGERIAEGLVSAWAQKNGPSSRIQGSKERIASAETRANHEKR
jgi:hypothetical protein